jgi:hypothetical protein
MPEPTDFETLKNRLREERRGWYAGTVSTEKMNATAKAAADAYNKKAREVAVRLKVPARLTTPQQLMRSVGASR